MKHAGTASPGDATLLQLSSSCAFYIAHEPLVRVQATSTFKREIRLVMGSFNDIKIGEGVNVLNAKLLKSILRWKYHVQRMENARIPKKIET
jgi:hypothetical protein